MAKRKLKKIAILAFSVLILTLIGYQTAGAANSASWFSMPAGTNNDLNGVWGSNAHEIYTVGNSGTIRYYDGTEWKSKVAGVSNDLFSVWGDDKDNIFIAGSSGAILHYDGSTWNTMNSGTYNRLNSIWGVSGTNVFVVGNSGTIIHYDGTAWSSMNSGTANDLNSIWGIDADNIFVAGNSGTSLFYDGSTWSQITSGTSNNLQTVWAATNRDAFIAGDSGSIFHYDGSMWSSMVNFSDSSINSIWGTSGSDVFSVGNNGTIAHYNGVNWSSMNRDTLRGLHTIWGISNSNIFTVGQSGTILHYFPPSISSIVPVSGDQGDNINVTLNGSNLIDVNYINLGEGIAVNNVTSISANQIKANITIVSNAELGTRDVSITSSGGSFDLPGSFTITEAVPVLTSVSPDQDRQGSTVNVTLTGSNLSKTSSIQFGAGIAVNTFSVLSPDQLAVNISLAPDAAAGTRDISITTASGAFTLSNSFTVKPAIPNINSINPNQGNQEKTLDITIEGTNLTGADELNLGEGIIINKFIILSSSQITANISVSSRAAVGTRDISITTPGGSFTLTNGFTVKQALPVITSVNPNLGSQGATLNVTITGMNLNGASVVSFGADIAVYSFSILSSDQLTTNITIVPSAVLGTREVSVTTPGGNFILPNSFTVIQALPVIASVNPIEGNQETAVAVIISGSNLNGATAVNFGPGITVQGFYNLSPTQLKVSLFIDKGAVAGPRDITVTTPGGSSVLGNGFTVKQASLSPLVLALIWTGIGIIIILFIIIIRQVRQKRAANLSGLSKFLK